MAQIREIKKRIKAVGNIKRITNTMQMIATARFKSALDRAVASKPYTEKVRELVGELSAAASDTPHPLFVAPEPPVKREVVLVITSDRGLCGAYNSSVLRTVQPHLRELGEKAVLEVVGKKGALFFKFAGNDIATIHRQFGDEPSYDDVEALAERYMQEFIDGKYDKVSVAYMQFVSAGRQYAVIEQVLPLSRDEAASDEATEEAASIAVDYEYSPDAATLLAALLPITVKTGLFQAFNDALVSEHVARMIAMKAATDNAGKLSKTLKRNFNRARQAVITTELTEIIGGAASLE